MSVKLCAGGFFTLTGSPYQGPVLVLDGPSWTLKFFCIKLENGSCPNVKHQNLRLNVTLLLFCPVQGWDDPDHRAVPVPVLHTGPVQPPAAAEPGTEPPTAEPEPSLEESVRPAYCQVLRSQEKRLSASQWKNCQSNRDFSPSGPEPDQHRVTEPADS